MTWIWIGDPKEVRYILCYEDKGKDLKLLNDRKNESDDILTLSFTILCRKDDGKTFRWNIYVFNFQGTEIV